MTFLFDIYEFSRSMICVGVSRPTSCIAILARRPDMFLKTVMMLLCTAGAAFYMRFLVALWKDRRPHSGGYWVRLRFDSGEGALAELPEQRQPVSRAA